MTVFPLATPVPFLNSSRSHAISPLCYKELQSVGRRVRLAHSAEGSYDRTSRSDKKRGKRLKIRRLPQPGSNRAIRTAQRVSVRINWVSLLVNHATLAAASDRTHSGMAGRA